MSTNNFIHIAPWLVLAAAILGLCFAAYKFFWVKARPEGTAKKAQKNSAMRVYCLSIVPYPGANCKGFLKIYRCRCVFNVL